MWTKDNDALMLMAVLATDHVGEDIVKEDVEEFKKTLPPFLTKEEVIHWVESQNLNINQIGHICPPSGWYFSKTSDSRYFLCPMVANHGAEPVELLTISEKCQD